MEEKKIKKSYKLFPWFKIGVIFVFAFLFFMPKAADAAKIYFSPSSGTYTVGNIFTVSVYTDTQGAAINNAEAVINFPTEFLDVVSISQSTSIFTLWVQPPIFSNSNGTVTFNGGLPTPGYAGATGKLFSIVFKAQKPGTASLLFSSAAVRANDGLGTDILKTRGEASFNLVSPIPTVEEPEVTAKTPRAPQVSSPTHPNSANWYSHSDPEFRWSIGTDITGVNVLVDKKPTTNPGTRSDGVMTTYKFKDVEDGVWYFHIRLRNAKGWGAITHYKFNIDTVPPKLSIEFVDGKETNTARPQLILNASDGLSGISHFKIKIDNNEFLTVQKSDLENSIYTLPLQTSGKHSILVQAFDMAGNYTTVIDEFVVKALPAPIIDVPKEAVSGETLLIKGSAFPESTVTVYIQKDSEEVKTQTTVSKKDGTFTIVYDDRLKEGIYRVWGVYVTESGAISAASEKQAIAVRASLIWKFGISTLLILVLIIISISLLILVLLLLWYIWRKLRDIRKRIYKDVKKTEDDVDMAFKKLRKDVQKQVRFLEKVKLWRELTSEEEKILKQLRTDLNNAEALIKKELKAIKKKVRM